MLINNQLLTIEEKLFDIDNFKISKIVDYSVPDQPGFYCIRITENNLPDPFNTLLNEREHNIIYIGIASDSLNKRFLHQELRARGHGTFFRSIGAVLGYRPEPGSLRNMKNKSNYKFSKSDETEIIKWINLYLSVNWVVLTGGISEIEEILIKKYTPLFNIKSNPLALEDLKRVRKECVRIAN
jgi:hypothetical protein